MVKRDVATGITELKVRREWNRYRGDNDITKKNVRRAVLLVNNEAEDVDGVVREIAKNRGETDVEWI